MQRSDQEQIFECDGALADQQTTSLDQYTRSSEHELQRSGLRLEEKEEDSDRDRDSVSHKSLQPLQALDFFHNQTLSLSISQSQSLSQSHNHNHNQRLHESPYSRYLRIKMELQQLQEDLQEMDDCQAKGQQSIWALLQNETKKLSLESDQLLEKFPSTLSHSPNASPQEELHQHILQDIQQKLTATGVVGGGSSGVSVANNSNIGFQTDGKAFMALEQRVYRLETLLGIHSNFLDTRGDLSLGSSVSAMPLVQIVHKLEQKLLTLDANTLDGLKVKFLTLKSELSSTSGSENTVTKVLESMKKIDNVIDNIHKIEAVVEELPVILLRLKTLETIHWNASMFTNRLHVMEEEIHTMTKEINSNQDVLEEIKMGLQENLQIMQDNMQKVESRLSNAKL